MRDKLKKLTELGLKVEIRRNRMVIRLPGDVLFASGDDKLSKEGDKVLDAVAEVIRNDKQLSGRYFQVAGHTDNKPLKGGRFGDNWGLSAMRARQVLLYLVSPVDAKEGGGGLTAERLHAAGYGDTDPVAKNDADDGRKQNRRVELVLDARRRRNARPQVADLSPVEEFRARAAARRRPRTVGAGRPRLVAAWSIPGLSDKREPRGRRRDQKPETCGLRGRVGRSLWATSSAPVWAGIRHAGLDAPGSPDTSATSAEELMERYVDGHADAFDALYRKLSPTLMGYLLRLTRNRARAEDLLQITFTKVHRARASYLQGRPRLAVGGRHRASLVSGRTPGRRRKKRRLERRRQPARAPPGKPPHCLRKCRTRWKSHCKGCPRATGKPSSSPRSRG